LIQSIQSGLLGLLLCVLPAAALAAPPKAPVAAALKSEFQRFFNGAHLASATVRVSRNGRELFSGSYGMADLEQNVRATPRTVYAIGSISKSFTAYCILKLAQEGKLNLDASLGSILPDIKGPPAKVTIRQMLVHTGGIPDYEPSVAKDEARTYSKDEIFAVFNNKPLEFEPGAYFAYSNSDHYLLGLIIERVTGKTYAQNLDEMIFKPFALKHTYYGARAPIIPWRARGYDLDDKGKLINADPWHESVPFAAGGIVSTAADVDLFTESLVAGKGKGPLTHAFDHVKLTNGTELSYLPISLAEGRFKGQPYYWHAGSIDGFLSFSAIIPSEHLTFSMLLNTIDPSVSPYALYHHVLRITLGLPPSEKEVPLDPKEAANYAGNYDLFVLSALDGGHLMSRSFPAQFALENGHLVRKAGILGADKALLHIGGGRFVAPDDPDQVYLFTQRGSVMHVEVDDITPWAGDRVK
jgi:D-alanyl-D-alanine carboxypeptidase